MSVLCSIPIINLFSAYVKNETDYEILFGFFQPHQLSTDFTFWICIDCGIDMTHIIIKVGHFGGEFHANWGTETPEGFLSFIQDSNIHHVTVLQRKAEEITFLHQGTVNSSIPDFREKYKGFSRQQVLEWRKKIQKYNW